MGGGRKTTTICVNCQREFVVFQTALNAGKGKFCSRACQLDGRFNPNYRGIERLTNYEMKLRAMEKNPQRFAAMEAVRNAINRGALIRQPCMVCGNTKSEAHHQDYNKPLDVQWLCREHHIKAHHS